MNITEKPSCRDKNTFPSQPYFLVKGYICHFTIQKLCKDKKTLFARLAFLS
jgi:hypothetical protein